MLHAMGPEPSALPPQCVEVMTVAPKGVPMPTFARPAAPGGSEARDWMVNAKCRGESPELFYTNRGARGSASTRQVEVAQRVCFGCPVINECAKYADANQETWGVWGGVDRSPKNFKDKRWRELSMQCGQASR